MNFRKMEKKNEKDSKNDIVCFIGFSDGYALGGAAKAERAGSGRNSQAGCGGYRRRADELFCVHLAEQLKKLVGLCRVGGLYRPWRV